MIKWTISQKMVIWRLYSEDQLSFADIAARYAELGATHKTIAGLIDRMHVERDAQLKREIETSRRKQSRYQGRGGYLKEKRSDNKLTREEISNIRTIRP